MATLTELNSQLAEEKAALVETEAEIADLTTEIEKHRTAHSAQNTTKLAKIEAALPAQRAIDRANNQLWETEQNLQRDLSSKIDQEEKKAVQEATIAQLEADIKAAGG